MSAGSRTFGIQETLIEPQVLPPPPTRHALFVFLLALAAILHVGTTGWSEIHNGPEGYYAGTAREYLDAPAGLALATPRQPPLLLWLLLGSFKTFGCSAMATRLPIALATMAAVAWTFLLGERIAGYWRGFAAGLLHLCSLGLFVWGRLVTPEPIFAAALGGALLCALNGYQRQKSRRFWLAAVWVCAAFIFLTKGLLGLAALAGILLLAALPFRAARLRFCGLLQWPGLLLFLALAAAWPLWCYVNAGPHTPFSLWDWCRGLTSPALVEKGGLGLRRFLLPHLTWWFPALPLILPGLALAWRKIFRPHEFSFTDVLPLAWLAVVFLPLLFSPARQDYQSVGMWGAFALLAAVAWDRMPPPLRLAGLGLTALLALAAAGIARFGFLPRILPAPAWDAVEWLVFTCAALVCVAAAVAAYFTLKHREILALTILLLSIVPVGLTIAEAMVRFEAHLSFARAAAFLAARLGDEGEVLYEGSALSGSSLLFYLDRPYVLIEDGPRRTAESKAITPETALLEFGAPRAVFLIIPKARVPFWQERLTAQFHLFHRETVCGDHVVLSNQP